MPLKRIYIAVENTDSTTTEGVRLLAADRVRAQKIAHTNNIPWSEGPACEALLAYCALTRSGATTAPDFDTWLAHVADFAITTTPPTDEPDEDPTSEGPEA